MAKRNLESLQKQYAKSSHGGPGGPGGPRGGGPRGGGPHGRGMGGKPKNAGHTIARLLGYLRPHTFALIMVLVCMLTSTVTSLIGSYLLSPVINHLAFGMPAAAVLTPILVKSTILALTAGYVASHSKKVSITLMAGVVLTYQLAGGLFEWAYTSSFAAAVQDFKLGLPGMLLQIVGGYLFIKYLLKK